MVNYGVLCVLLLASLGMSRPVIVFIREPSSHQLGQQDCETVHSVCLPGRAKMLKVPSHLPWPPLAKVHDVLDTKARSGASLENGHVQLVPVEDWLETKHGWNITIPNRESTTGGLSNARPEGGFFKL